MVELKCKVITLLLMISMVTSSPKPIDFIGHDPITHTIDLDNTLPENRWKNLFGKKCEILREFVPTQMKLIQDRLIEKWHSDISLLKPRLFKAYQEVPWLRDSDFLKEINSISEGCQIDLAEMLMLNYVYDIFGGGCTSIVFNDVFGNPKLASNLDFDNGAILAK